MSSSINIKGLDKLEKHLKQMEKGAKELEGTNHVSFGELFTVFIHEKIHIIFHSG